MHLVPLLFYAAAAAAYAAHFAWRDERIGRFATALLGSGLFAHTFLIGMQTVQAGHAPLVGRQFDVQVCQPEQPHECRDRRGRADERSFGVFVAILLVVLGVIPALDGQLSERPPVLQSPLFTIHVMAMLFADASFALAGIHGLTYVLMFKEIKAKHLGFFYARLPSLKALDVMNGRAVVVGWVFLTVGVVVGALWAMQVQHSPDPRVQAMSLRDPKILVAVVCWVLYSFAVYARRAAGWSGRRAAWLSTVGFIVVLLNFVPVGYFFTRSHNF